MSVDQQTHQEHLFDIIVASNRFGDWIYHDVRLDCDDEAAMRTAIRLKDIHAQFGHDAMFGIAGWWAIKAYWRLKDAYNTKAIAMRPDLLPKDVDKIMASSGSEEQKRAVISSQQFISTITHNNLGTAEAIFNAAYESGVDEWVALMYSVLTFSIRISSVAHKIKYG